MSRPFWTPEAGGEGIRFLTPLTVVAAVSRNRVIGRDGRLPWRLASDLKRFRAATMGKPLIMGRKTYAEIGRPLPGRTTIVISSTSPGSADGLLHARSFEEARRLAAEAAARMGAAEAIVAGGSSVYRAAMGVASRLLLTVVETDCEGDAFFPDYDASRWRETSRERFEAGETDEFAVTVIDHVRPA